MEVELPVCRYVHSLRNLKTLISLEFTTCLVLGFQGLQVVRSAMPRGVNLAKKLEIAECLGRCMN